MLAGMEDLLAAMKHRKLVTAADESAGDQLFEAKFQVPPGPQMLGRYVVLGKLGRGGMGTVLEAFDRTLDRRVAIKVLHDELDDKQTKRLLREAQAMAKLSHPNVVQVYEAGEVGGQTFVAMELVQGQTLGQWMRQDPRPDWRTCVKVFIQLGAGLAAAHERGLVHRDFKPGNAIVDDEGRPRVLDFGLARKLDSKEESEASDPAMTWTEDDACALDDPLTRTGAVLGTPAYMPLEQMNGHEADARSDQFSFCVALYEAVYGERPFGNEPMLALLTALQRGVVRPAPKGIVVPATLRRVMLKGLAIDPAQRWPSMEVLLEELRRVVAPRRRRAMVVVVGGLLVVGGGLGTVQLREWLNRCTGARRQLEGVWDDVRRQEVETAILGTGLAYAPSTWERVEPRLDAYADAWANEHTDACEATRSRNEHSEEDMSRRMGCLHERWLHLRATVNELSHADATVVDHAVQSLANLPGLEHCRDLEALRAEVPPPEDPAIADQVAALDELLVEAKAKQESGNFGEGLRLADEVVEKGAGLDYEPLMARAWLRQGRLREDLGEAEGAMQALRKAYGAAVAHAMKAEAAEASTKLMYVSGYRLDRHEEARGWAEHAEPLSRAAGTDEARARYLNALGALAERQGEYEDAGDFFEQALALRKKALGPDHPDVAFTLNNLGVVAEAQGRYEEARNSLERALEIFETTLGPDHPNVAFTLNNLGRVAISQGEYEEAQEVYERALAIREKALGPDHNAVANLLDKLGDVAILQAEYEEAQAVYERALAIREKALGPDDPLLAHPLTGLGDALLGLGKPASAILPLERALTLCTTHEVTPTLLAEARFALSRSLWAAPATQGRDRPRAHTLAEQARNAYAALGERKQGELAEVETWLRRVAAGEGEADGK